MANVSMGESGGGSSAAAKAAAAKEAAAKAAAAAKAKADAAAKAAAKAKADAAAKVKAAEALAKSNAAKKMQEEAAARVKAAAAKKAAEDKKAADALAAAKKAEAAAKVKAANALATLPTTKAMQAEAEAKVKAAANNKAGSPAYTSPAEIEAAGKAEADKVATTKVKAPTVEELVSKALADTSGGTSGGGSSSNDTPSSGGGGGGGYSGGGGGSYSSGGARGNMEEFNSFLDEMLNSDKTNFSYDKIAQMELVLPVLRTAEELAKTYGLDYNAQNIYDTLMKSTDAGFDVRYRDQKNSESKYYDNTAASQSTLADTLRQQQSQAIMTGTNRGMQAANALSTMLGTSQQFADQATLLAQERGKLSTEYGAAKAKTGVDSMNAYNAMGADLAELSKSLYSSDTSSYVGQLGYNSDVNNANATMAAQAMKSKSDLQASLANSLTSVWNQYYSGQITLEAAQMAADASIKAAATYGSQSAGISAASNANIAAANNATQTAIANSTNATNTANTNATIAGNQALNDANNTNANRNTMNSNLAGLQNLFTSGSYNSAQAQAALDGWNNTGQVDASVYNTLTNMFKPKTTPTTTPSTVTTPGVTDKSLTNILNAGY